LASGLPCIQFGDTPAYDETTSPTPSQNWRYEALKLVHRPTQSKWRWGMYTVKPPTLPISPATFNRCPSTHRPWWTIPEAERLHMHAFTRPSQQLRLKMGHALLRSLHHIFLYMRLIFANKGLGARLHIVGQSIHKRINSVPKEGPTLLQRQTGQEIWARPHGRMPTLSQARLLHTYS
jgi:hypothetical protein